MRKVIIGTILLGSLVGCSSTEKGVSLEQKYNISKASIKEWDTTISKVIEGEALISDWYGEENPINYLAKTGKLSKKDYDYLMYLSEQKTEDIPDEDYGKFIDLVEKYNKKTPRKFFLEKENFKNPKGLVDKMISESYLKMETPSSHIKNNVATEKEWDTLVELSKKDDLDEKDVKSLKKILNKFIKRDEFFNERAWYAREISPRLVEIINISKKETTSLEKNNVNAKALYIAYPEYLSPLGKWGD